MAKYTIELRQLMSDPLFNLFDFDYDFYSDDIEIKKDFEHKFIQRYFFNEIGFETIQRFKFHVKQTLDLKANYYKQLYQSELRVKDIDFMLNKDYTETQIIEFNKKSDVENNNTTNENYKESNLDNGNANLSSNSLTSINESDNKTSDKTLGNEEGTQTQTLKGRGNIGITSSSELLIKWRESFININEMLLEEFQELFMGVY